MKPRKAKRSSAARPIGTAEIRARQRRAEEEQRATSEILAILSKSPSDVQPVFDTIIRSAVRLGDADLGTLFRLDGTSIHVGAHCKLNAQAEALYARVFPQPLNDGSPYGRAMLEGKVVNMPDLQKLAFSSESRDRARVLGIRAVLAVPVRGKNGILGALVIGRRAAGAFPRSYVRLLESFADQAAIAMENVRLFSATKESLARQTATAEILKVIASSPSDVQPVFDAIVRSAGRLAAGSSVNVSRLVGDRLYLAAYTPVSPVADEVLRNLYPIPITEARPLAEAVRRQSSFFVGDFETDPDVGARAREVMRARGFRSTLYVPIVHGDVVHGVLHVSKLEPGPFPQQWVELLETFASQAVIAIENVRLFNETKEALERQTATAEILRVISSTPTETQPVFDAIVRSGLRVFAGSGVGIALVQTDRVRIVSAGGTLGATATTVDMPLNAESTTGTAIVNRTVVNTKDTEAPDAPPYARDNGRALGFRSIAAAPMLREGMAIGAVGVTLKDPGGLSDKHLELLKTFADQAVIAIENVRLFNETAEALEQQTTTAEILRVISSSPTDVQPVFDAIVQSAARLFAPCKAVIVMREGDRLQWKARAGPQQSPADVDRLYNTLYPLPLDPERSVSARAILERRMIYVSDTEASGIVEAARVIGRAAKHRSLTIIPLLRDGDGIGTLGIQHPEPGFKLTDKQLALLRTFADQAVIAIQNARLFHEIHEKSEQLEIANRHKSEFLANMSHELRTPLNAIIGFTRIVMRRSKEQLDPKQYENLEKIHSSGHHLLQLINAILDLSKVEAGRVEVNAGEVALRSVLEQCVKTVEPLVNEPAVRLLKEFDRELPQVYIDEEKLRQIVINLLSNAVKFTDRGTVRVQAKANGESFAVAVADTGIGIPADKLEHVFEEFAQADASSTRVYGGTGLGLTIARRLARLMGGEIVVKSAPGQGSTFTLTLPVRYHA
ncbi:MAG TPA: GAF domain-containing protein [Burkholderiales bacterium]|nr:GAF domain-containing protein [Burkholderiales bacterium]